MKQKFTALFTYDNLFLFLRSYLFLTIGTLLVVASFDIFMRRTNIAPGGVMGLALIVNHLTGLALGTATLLLQIPMLILGFYFLGRFHFLVTTWYVTLLYGFCLDYFTGWLPQQGLTDDLLLNTLYGGVLGGIGLGLIFLGRGAFAGTGIISRIIQLKTGLPITQLYMMVDGGIIFMQGLFFGWEIALYALLMLFIYGLATDYMLEGPSVIRTVFIITTHPEEISRALFERLGVGITGWDSKGMYTHTEKTTLFCTVYRPDIALVKVVVGQVDPGAFVVIGQGHQASGGVLRHKIQRGGKPKVETPETPQLAVKTG
ncbi:MAG TPA: YitT family protein [Anaerolineae bacterium]|nr:YitT family protein [Anaerolineae bacterium]MCB0179873.1 YitT family protein [Anaerolineae bacterium]MCB0226041.1 YitT family protein [Anaerolineae bacterium]MCB9108799.1 YitT family protein [Anaerolineales bacterium]HRV96407.1 YitT family protein [Anaerolineae bacterium]